MKEIYLKYKEIKGGHLLWAFGVERQRDVAKILDVERSGFCRNSLPLRALLLVQLILLVDLLGCRFDHGSVLVQLVLQPLDKFVLLVELQLQLVNERVPLAQLLDLLLERVLEVAQGAHGCVSTEKFSARSAAGSLPSLLF